MILRISDFSQDTFYMLKIIVEEYIFVAKTNAGSQWPATWPSSFPGPPRADKRESRQQMHKYLSTGILEEPSTSLG